MYSFGFVLQTKNWRWHKLNSLTIPKLARVKRWDFPKNSQWYFSTWLISLSALNGFSVHLRKYDGMPTVGCAQRHFRSNRDYCCDTHIAINFSSSVKLQFGFFFCHHFFFIAVVVLVVTQRKTFNNRNAEPKSSHWHAPKSICGFHAIIRIFSESTAINVCFCGCFFFCIEVPFMELTKFAAIWDTRIEISAEFVLRTDLQWPE